MNERGQHVITAVAAAAMAVPVDVLAGTLFSCRTVIGYLNRVGLAARDPFDCPLASRLRPS